MARRLGAGWVHGVLGWGGSWFGLGVGVTWRPPDGRVRLGFPAGSDAGRRCRGRLDRDTVSPNSRLRSKLTSNAITKIPNPLSGPPALSRFFARSPNVKLFWRHYTRSCGEEAKSKDRHECPSLRRFRRYGDWVKLLGRPGGGFRVGERSERARKRCCCLAALLKQCTESSAGVNRGWAFQS